MGSKGNNSHIKRLAAPRYLHVERKVHAYVMKPNAGRHTLDSSIALSDGAQGEARCGIRTGGRLRGYSKSGNVEVNGKPITDERYPLGFGDVIHFKPSNEPLVQSA